MINNHFIVKYNLYGMVTRRSLHWVPWRSTTSLFFNVTLYTLIHFWLSTKKVKYQLKQLFLHEYQIWRTVRWNWQCFTKMETLPLPVSIICLKTLAFPTFMPRHFTTLRNNVTQWLTAMIIDLKIFILSV